MGRRISTHIVRAVLTAGIVLGVLGVALRLRSGQALAATGNIDLVNKWAWGLNVGWINFRPDHGGVTVYSDRRLRLGREYRLDQAGHLYRRRHTSL